MELFHFNGCWFAIYVMLLYEFIVRNFWPDIFSTLNSILNTIWNQIQTWKSFRLSTQKKSRATFQTWKKSLLGKAAFKSTQLFQQLSLIVFSLSPIPSQFQILQCFHKISLSKVPWYVLKEKICIMGHPQIHGVYNSRQS